MTSYDDSTKINNEEGTLKDSQSQLINIDDTAIIEYFDIIKKEYEIERNKKQSFENRAGLILALLGAICIFLFENIELKFIISLMNSQMNFLDFIKILSGLVVYIGFIFTIIMIIKTITINQHNNFEVKSINEELLSEQRITSLCRIIFTYRDIILQHREMNEERAKTFRKSLYGISITLIAIIIYVAI